MTPPIKITFSVNAVKGRWVLRASMNNTLRDNSWVITKWKNKPAKSTVQKATEIAQRAMFVYHASIRVTKPNFPMNIIEDYSTLEN